MPLAMPPATAAAPSVIPDADPRGWRGRVRVRSGRIVGRRQHTREARHMTPRWVLLDMRRGGEGGAEDVAHGADG